MPDLTSSWMSRLASRGGPDVVGTDHVRPAAAPPRRRTAVPGRRTQASASDAVPWSVRAAAAWSWRVLVLAAAAAVLVYLVITFKTIVVSVLVAILLSVLLDPVSSMLRRRLRLPRTLASAVTILVTLAVVVGLLVLAGRSIASGFGALAQRANQGFGELISWLSTGPLQIDQPQIDTWLTELQGQIQANASTIVGGVLSATGSVTSVVTGAVIALFCLFFFLKEGRTIWQWVCRLTPASARDRINEAGIRGWVTLGAYARTQILVAFVDAVGIGLGAFILGVPLALPLTVLVFLGSFIPIVGAVLTGSIAVLVALVDQGLVTALIMLGIVLLVQQLESNLLQPWLMGNAVSLHPIAVLLAVTAGTGIAGVLGALFAVPFAAVINTVVLYLHGHDKYPRLATDLNRPGGPPGALAGAIEDAYAHVAEEDDDGGVLAESGDDENHAGATAVPADDEPDERR
ncbi:AI-2E family transporter [Georgenia sp. SYP-B2076]|uniref:AI-2E family transporter n=1 Tax=Georgenia sp. SYP-B2076 TaxID=2495881 RepID=UPI001F0CB01F|nr:AI-2E family transporter [Georgenia sp. SYP-B2076]